MKAKPRFDKYYWNGSARETRYLHTDPAASMGLATRAEGSYAQAQLYYP